jgi:5-methylcytosine-specific restriction endonuclease McrA
LADQPYKVCSRCREEKPAADFSPDRRASDGLQTACRACSRAAKKAARDANLDEYRAKERAYVQANKERVYQRNNEYRERHADRVKAKKRKAYERIKNDPDFIARRDAYAVATKDRKREYDREYRNRNRERINKKSAAWRKANPEKRTAIIRGYAAKRRTQVKSGVSTVALAAWCAAQRKVCYWCGAKCPKGYHVDHYVPLSKGGRHDLHNLVIACGPCNLRKNAKDPLDFAREVGRLF